MQRVELLNETIELGLALSNHTSSLRLFLLGARKLETIVHFAFLGHDGLLLLYFSHASLFGFVGLVTEPEASFDVLDKNGGVAFF